MRKEIIGACELYQGDCLDILPEIGKVDAVITDPPYGITGCHWDQIDIDALLKNFWEKVPRKPETPIIAFCASKFTFQLVNSNFNDFRYRFIWLKNYSVGFANSHKMPMRRYEEIAVFYQKLPVYNPQGVTEGNGKRSCYRKEGCYGKMRRDIVSGKTGFPHDVLEINDSELQSNVDRKHPTQKPVKLIQYLINTYSNAGNVILDPFMGSGTTGVACIETGRKFIGIELDGKYFDIACKRIENAYKQGKLEFGEAG